MRGQPPGLHHYKRKRAEESDIQAGVDRDYQRH
jgi:hypothetical protein